MLIDLKHVQKKYNLNINGVIHVGAHFGEEHETYLDMGIDKIVYFEPVNKTFKVLEERIKDFPLFNCALGSTEMTTTMFIEDEDKFGCSSILEPSDNYIGHALFSEKQIVQIKTLDSFEFSDFNFLNIDVQGYELEVLKGSKETLNNIDYIMCEVHRNVKEKNLDYINSPLIEDINNFLSDFGFVLCEQNWAGISWGDAFYIKK
jgi:FkbM family methyltransferase